MTSAPSLNGHRVAIIGGGFGGLYAARQLGRDPRVDLTLLPDIEEPEPPGPQHQRLTTRASPPAPHHQSLNPKALNAGS